MSLEVISPGSGIALHDAGRSGWLRFGVPPCGAMDRHAMRAANGLLGNRANAPVLEILLQGARLRVLEDMWVAVTGADFCPTLSAWTARMVKRGEVIEFRKQACGLFAYLAVPGGFVAERWFGSVCAEPRSGLGTPLPPGRQLTPAAKEPNLATRGIARRILVHEERRSYGSSAYFTLLPGPQFGSFSRAAQKSLVSTDWVVSPQSDRAGYRLEGPAITVPDPIRSEPVLPGSFQVPGNGQPIITMIDGPTVGGYPKIAVLAQADRDRLAQCAPGTQLHFRWAD